MKNNNEKIVMTKDEWMKKGKELFGEDDLDWIFVCPGCGNIQKVIDFKKFKDKGADRSSAYQECIGRYSGGRDWLTGNKETKPCNYAAYGLLNIAPVIVKEGNIEIPAFAFHENKGSLIDGD